MIAAETLRQELFQLLARFKDFEQRQWQEKDNSDASQDANAAACALARVYEQIFALPTFSPGASDV